MDELHLALEQSGLTSSEQAVYLALLKEGELSKTPLVRAAKISASKVYDVAARLIDKGLVAEILRDGVKHFRAAPPKRVLTYLQDKQDRIDEVKQQFSAVLPKLNALQEKQPDSYEVEVFRGWKGLRTIYEFIFELLQDGETDYVIGASSGENPIPKSRFYNQMMQRFHDHGIPIQVIFNEEARESFENSPADTENIAARYLPFTSPTEINIAGDYCFIITLAEEPVAIRIHSKKTADGFKEYFDTLWALAKD